MLVFLFAVSCLAHDFSCGTGSSYNSNPSPKTYLSQPLAKNDWVSPLRLTIDFLSNSNLTNTEKSQLDEAFESVKDFYSSSLSIFPLSQSLKPSKSSCGKLEYPEDALKTGYEADVVVFLYAFENIGYTALAQVCEQDGGDFKRPLVGAIGVNPLEFFEQGLEKMIVYLIHETAHVLAFNSELFQDFVQLDKTPYLPFEYENYVEARGKMVKMIGFPKSLDKAKRTFSCLLEGLELEDYNSDVISSSHWESRIMPEDIMSSFLLDNPIFSDITLGLFEDSSWYFPNYSLSSSIIWGKNEGCSWIQEKCFDEGKTLKGFCNGQLDSLTCDMFNISYGKCFYSEYENIPSYEQYFDGENKGGVGYLDYCSIVLSSEDGLCRNDMGNIRSEFGETKGLNSRCFMSTIGLDSTNTMQPVCYTVMGCKEDSLDVKIGESSYNCKYGQKLNVNGLSGFVQCPESYEFCTNAPCVNLCSGRGTCHESTCSCYSGYGNSDCSLNCYNPCRNCQDSNSQCTSCFDGYYLNTNDCFQCNDNCFTCKDSSTNCLTCKDGFILQPDNTCKKICPLGCSDCSSQSICTKCEIGFVLSYDLCIHCEPPCASCTSLPSSCTSCIENYSLSGKTCTYDCVENCINCEKPCRGCVEGYFLINNLCEKCEDSCKTCITSPGSCSSCNKGYSLKNSHCEKVCLPNCKSCDEPCLVCEDGYIRSPAGECEFCKNYLESSEVTAEYIRDYRALLVILPSSIVELTNSCKKIVKNDSLERFGQEVACLWETRSRLIINLGKDMDYSIEKVELFPIATYGTRCTNVPIDLEVYIAKTLIKPEASISAPYYYSLSCNNGFLLIQGITGESKWNFDIKVNPESDDINRLVKKNQSKTLSIPHEMLQVSKIDVFFNATNVLGKVVEKTKTINIVKQEKLSLSIDLGSSITIKSGQELKLRAVVQESPCITADRLKFIWNYIESSSNSFTGSESILSESKIPYELIIRPSKLPPNRNYIFRVEAQDNKISAFADIVIKVEPSELVLKLDRSDGSANIYEDLTISALESYDPDDPNTNLKYLWTCYEENSECVDNVGELLIGKEDEKSLRVISGRLVERKKYLFTLSIYDDNRSTSRSVIITASNSKGVVKTPDLPNKVNIDRELFVYPEYFYEDGDRDNEPSFMWKQVAGENITSQLKMDLPYLVIPRGVMGIDRDFEFKVEMNNTGKIAFGDVYWVTNAGPECGEVSADVNNQFVVLKMNCFDNKPHEAPLNYVYGIITNQIYNPLIVSKRSSMLLHLNQGVYELYIKACDCYDTCITKSTKLNITQRFLTDSLNNYNNEKKFPEALPLAIWNNALTFNTETFALAFNDLVTYISNQDIELVHLNIAITCLEVLTSSNKTHFMYEHQKEILTFLTKIVNRLDYIEDENMQYLVDFLSQNKVNNYQIVSNAVSVFSTKWMTKFAPKTKKILHSKISVMRHRVIGNSLDNIYIFKSLTVSNINLPCAYNEICDLLITVLPGSPMAIIDVRLFKVGIWEKSTVKFYKEKEFHPDLLTPMIIQYNFHSSAHFECLQLREDSWVEEGCRVINQTSKFTLAIWHMSLYKLIYYGDFSLGYSSLITEFLLISLCISGTIFFCAIDTSYKNSLQSMSYQEPDSPKSSEKVKFRSGSRVFEDHKLDEINQRVDDPNINYENKDDQSPNSEEHKDFPSAELKPPNSDLRIEMRLDSRPVNMSIETGKNKIIKYIMSDDKNNKGMAQFEYPNLLYHPILNIIMKQLGNRRVTSFLHLFAVLFFEFMAIGIAMNPGLYRIFDANNNFNGVEYLQIYIFVVGTFLSQSLSMGLMILNEINNHSLVRKFTAIGISVFTMFISAVISGYLGLVYPAVYSFYWTMAFLVYIVIDFLVFQMILWRISIMIFRKTSSHDILYSPSIQLFTADR